MNTNLFARIKDVMDTKPQKFDMDTWEKMPTEYEPCGTTRCLAGWAIAFTTGEPVLDKRGLISDATVELAGKEGFGYSDWIETAARKALGMPKHHADVFYDHGREIVDQYVSLAADGLDAEADALVLDWLGWK